MSDSKRIALLTILVLVLMVSLAFVLVDPCNLFAASVCYICAVVYAWAIIFRMKTKLNQYARNVYQRLSTKRIQSFERD